MRRLASVGLGVTALLLGSLGLGPAAQAAECPPASVGGKTIGWVEFDDVRVPIKKTDYPAGGELDPPASNQVAGMSTRHQGLLSDVGSTVIAWHVRYGKGCNGTLNPILKKNEGDTFDIVTTSGDRRTYELVDRANVKRGKYEPEWFRLHGTPQVTLFTCSDLRNGKYERTRVLVGVPVEQA
jgi:hypothetical protein